MLLCFTYSIMAVIEGSQIDPVLFSGQVGAIPLVNLVGSLWQSVVPLISASLQ
jgi:hypothetical protein